MGERVTIYDIAREAGVGIATVSRVLNGDLHVRPSTRVNVQQAIAHLGYRPSRAARRLAGGGPSRPRVAALLPFFTAAFYFAVTRSLAAGLKAADIDLVLHDIKSREDKNRVIDRLLAERACEGIVLISCGVGQERREQLERLAVPAVCADYRSEGLPSISVDNRQGGRLAAEHLIACGARRPALLAGPSKAATLRERAQAFADHFPGLPVMSAGAVGQEAGRIATADLLDEHAEVDALFCVNDMIAVGALEELAARGIRVPDDVQVLGYDDQPLMNFIGLSTIRQPISKLGRWSAATIAKRIAQPMSRPRSTDLAVELVPRRTTLSAVAETAPLHATSLKESP